MVKLYWIVLLYYPEDDTVSLCRGYVLAGNSLRITNCELGIPRFAIQ